jgi:hypothetical protein
VKIRLHATEDECHEVAERLTGVVEVLALSAPYPDRGASVLVRMYVRRGSRRLCTSPAPLSRGPLDHDASQLLVAADRYDGAARPLQQAEALEAAAGEFVGAGDLRQARAAFTRALDVYDALGAAADVDRLRPSSVPAASSAGRTPRTGRRIAAGPASRQPRSRSPAWWRRDCPTRKSPKVAGVPADCRDLRLKHSEEARRYCKSRTDIAREAVLRTIAPR